MDVMGRRRMGCLDNLQRRGISIMSRAQIFKVLGSALLLLLISSCDTEQKASDDYYFEDKEYTLIEQDYIFVVVDNKEEWNDLVKQYVGPGYKGDQMGAFSRLRLNRQDPNLAGSECIVYIKDPTWTYEPEYIGHEIVHCLFGKWHPSQRGKG